MSLTIKGIQHSKNYNKIQKKIEKLMKIDFNTRPTYGDDDDKYIKTRIKTYKNIITTNFYNKNGSRKIPEEKVPDKCFFNNNFRFCYDMKSIVHKHFQKNVNMRKKR